MVPPFLAASHFAAYGGCECALMPVVRLVLALNVVSARTINRFSMFKTDVVTSYDGHLMTKRKALARENIYWI
jgi:hypothetical protein